MNNIRKLKKKVSRSAKFMSEISGDVFQASDKLEAVGDLSKTRDIDIVRLLKAVKILQDEVILIKARLTALK